MKAGALIVSGGDTDKKRDVEPLRQIGGASVLRRLITVFHLAGIDTIAVAAAEKDLKRLEKDAARSGVTFLAVENGGTEMLDYVKTGLAYLEKLCGQVFVTPVDVPLFSSATLKLLASYGHKLVVPVWQGKKGHPLLIAREVIPSILQYQGGRGLAGAVSASEYPLTLAEVADQGVVLKSGQAEENRDILAAHELNRWRPVMRLQIARETVFLGPGVRQLLRLIGHTGSVQLASRQMGISYSKAWKMLNSLEEQLGYEVVLRRQGGRHGGETSLTGKGGELLEWFIALEKECDAAVKEIFARHLRRISGDSEEEQAE
jgi:molybdate transport repressor ModE-like protein